MITIFSIVAVVLILILLNIGLIIFVIPPTMKFIENLMRGEIFISIFEMFVTIFILLTATFGFLALIF